MPGEDKQLGVPYKIINGKRVYAEKRYRKSKFGKSRTFQYVWPAPKEEGESGEFEQG